MGVFVSLLLTTAVLAGPTVPEDPAARAQATLRRVAHLPPAEQRAWLEGLERRLALAATYAMRPEEAQREKDRVAALLREKTVAWPTLAQLLKQLDEREKAAIGRLVRQYRSQVYDTFRARPQSLMERQEAWYRVWAAWEAAARVPEEQYRLLEWLAAAIRSSTSGSVGPLPPDPRFGQGEEIAGPAAPPAPAAAPARPVPERSAESTVGPAAKSPFEESNPPALGLQPSPLPLRTPEPAVCSAPPRQGAVYVSPRRSEAALEPIPFEPPPAVVVLLPKEFRAGVETPAESAVSRGDLPHLARSEAGPGPLGKLLENELLAADPESPRPTRPVPRSVERIPRNSGGNSAFEAAEIRRQERPVSVRHALETALARPTVPQASIAPPAPATLPSEHVGVNVEELSARIAGINLALRTLEAELAEKRAWNVDELDALLNRLDILALRQKDLVLFRDLVSPEEQDKLGRIDSPRQAVASLAARIAEVRNQTVATPDASGPQQEALKHLDDLSDRLAALAVEGKL
jgi:hypothetical protein